MKGWLHLHRKKIIFFQFQFVLSFGSFLFGHLSHVVCSQHCKTVPIEYGEAISLYETHNVLLLLLLLLLLFTSTLGVIIEVNIFYTNTKLGGVFFCMLLKGINICNVCNAMWRVWLKWPKVFPNSLLGIFAVLKTPQLYTLETTLSIQLTVTSAYYTAYYTAHVTEYCMLPIGH